MKKIYLILMVCLMISPLFSAEVTKKIEQSLDIPKSGKLRVDNQFGGIYVEGWDKNEATLLLDIRVKSRREKDAKEMVELFKLDIDKHGSLVDVKIKNIENRIDDFKGSIEFNFTIKCNKSIALELRNRFGNITANDFNSIVELSNTNGSIEARNHANLNIHNQFGNIEVSNAKGRSFISNANGSINVFECMGELAIKNAFGSTSVRNCNGSIEVASKNGSLEVKDIKGERFSCANQFGNSEIISIGCNATIHSRNGSLRVEDIKGDASISNEFGETNIKNIEGNLQIQSQNGRISLENVKGDLQLSNSFADNIISNIQGFANIASANGKIVLTNAMQPITIENCFASTVLSNVNPKIEIETANGYVEIDNLKKGLIDIKVHNSFAAINVELPTGFEGTQIYETEFGEIKVDTFGDMEVEATRINKKGTTEDRVELRTANGNIRVTEK